MKLLTKVAKSCKNQFATTVGTAACPCPLSPVGSKEDLWMSHLINLHGNPANARIIRHMRCPAGVHEVRQDGESHPLKRFLVQSPDEQQP